MRHLDAAKASAAPACLVWAGAGLLPQADSSPGSRSGRHLPSVLRLNAKAADSEAAKAAAAWTAIPDPAVCTTFHAAVTQVFRHLVVKAQRQQLCQCGCLSDALSSDALGRLPQLSSSWRHCRHTCWLEQQARPPTVSATQDCRHRGLSQQGTSLRCMAHGLLQQQARAITASARRSQACTVVSEQATTTMLNRKGSWTVAMIQIEQKHAGTA